MRATLCILLGTVACASSSAVTKTGEAGTLATGTYEIVATIPGQHVNGIVQFETDTVRFRSETSCEAQYSSAGTRYLAMTQLATDLVGRTSITFGCGGAILSFDLRNPMQNPRWSARVPVQKLREVCARRETRNGREVCVQTTMERFEVLESRTGPIQVRRIP